MHERLHDIDLHEMNQRAPRFRNRPGFTALAVLLLSLGVGVTTAVFGLADGVLPHTTMVACETTMDAPGHAARFASASLPSREELRDRVSHAYETSFETAGDAIGSIPDHAYDLGDRAKLALIGAGALAVLLACVRGAAKLMRSQRAPFALASVTTIGAVTVAILAARTLELPPIGPRAIAFALCVSLLAVYFARHAMPKPRVAR